MADPKGVSYRINLNRMKTTKWAQAQPVDYGGDDWGEDEYDEYDPEPEPAHTQQPLSAPGSRQPTWGQPMINPSTRSFTNPIQPTQGGRLSFDRADERRNFSSGMPGSFEPEQPQATRPLTSTSQHDFESESRGHRAQPSLQLNTQVTGGGPLSAGPMQRSGLAKQNSGAPLSAPGAYSEQPSVLASRGPMDKSTTSNTKTLTSKDSEINTSLASKDPAIDQSQSGFPASGQPTTAAESSKDQASLASKPLPFIRPADIYKRMEEEREKERLSQETARPSIDSTTGVPKDLHLPIVHTTADDSEHAASLDTAVPEQSTNQSNQSIKQAPLSQISPLKQQSHEHLNNPTMVSRQASSVYSNRRDPVSASSTDSPPLSLPTLTEVQSSPGAVSPSPSPDIPQPAGDRRSTIISTNQDNSVQELPHYERGIAPHTVEDTFINERSQSTSHPSHNSSRFDAADTSLPSSVEQKSAMSTISDEEGANRKLPGDSAIFPSSSRDSNAEAKLDTTDRSTPGVEGLKLAGLEKNIAAEKSRILGEYPSSSIANQPSTSRRDHQSQEPIPIITLKTDDRRTQNLRENLVRDPSSTETSQLPAFEQGIVSEVPIASNVEDSDYHATPVVTQQATFPSDSLSATDESSSQSLNRTTSEDWHDWQAQRRSFHAQHGLEDSNSTTPALSSPISRAESPAKGTVREITDRLEGHSGRATPPRTNTMEGFFPAPPRPVQQNRLESFRPSIPGGWQSDTTTATLKNAKDDDARIAQPPFVREESRTTSTESIPTASAPKGWQPRSTGTIESAFAAAAAAGSAMAGAFSGRAFTRDSTQSSDSDSEDEAYPGHPNNQHPNLHTRDFAVEAPSPIHPKGVTPASPTTVSLSPNQQTSTENTPSDRHTPVDFPAPLRTNKQNEMSPASHRLSAFNPAIPSPDADNERLQEEIVQSLTPKTSNVEPTFTSTNTQSVPVPNKPETARDDRAKIGGSSPSLGHSVTLQDKPHTATPEKSTGSAVMAHDTNLRSPQNLTSTASSTNKRPLLDQKFSWEDNPQPHILPAPQQMIAEAATHTPSHAQSSSLYTKQQSTHDPGHVSDKAPVKHVQDDFLAVQPAPIAPIQKQNVGRNASVDENEARTMDVLSKPAIAQQKVADRPSTPTQPIIPTTSTFDTSTTETIDSPERAAHYRTLSYPESVSAMEEATAGSFPHEKVDFKSILGYSDSNRRIRAFDENRRLYAEPNGLLDNWLASLNIPEHADVFITSRQNRTHSPPTSNNRPMPPRRDVTSGSGTKQMQEDGKRLLAVAGKFGGKAGVAAKGLFAKGKDKLRTASASEKVSLSNRRRSAASEVMRPASPETQPSTQTSTLPSIAPQIPPPSLQTPTEEVSWSLISSTIDQLFTDPSYQSRNDGNHSQSQTLPQAGVRRASIGDVLERQTLAHATGDIRGTGHPETKSAEVNKAGALSLNTQGADELNSNKSESVSSVKQSTEGDGQRIVNTTQMANDANDRSDNRLQSHAPKHERKGSSISDVSEISRSSGHDDQRPNVMPNVARNVSPPPEEATQSRSQEVPIFLSHDLSKEAEAQREREFIESAPGHGSLPPYSSPVDRSSQARILSGTQVVPLGELKSARNSERRTSNRPFSFMGTETLSSVPSYRPGSSPPPISPIDQSQRRSRAGEKIREPNILDHPAYRSTDDVALETSTENPIPNPRQSLEEVSDVRQRSAPSYEDESSTGGYRIPGPYVQEYRPPKPKPSSERVVPAKGRVSLDSRPIVDDNPSATSANIVEPNGPRNPGMNAEVEPIVLAEPRPLFDLDKSRTRSFGSLFRSRSGSRRREERQDGNETEIVPEEKKKQRRVVFRLNSRTASPGPQLEDLPEDKVQPPRQLHRRMLSTDLLKGKGFGLRSQSDGKKRRSSGISNFFSRSSNKEKSRPSTAMSQRSDMSIPTQQPSLQSLRRAAGDMDSVSAYTGSRDEQYAQNAQPVVQNGRSHVQNNSAYYETRGYHEPNKSVISGDDSDLEGPPDSLRIDTSSDGRPSQQYPPSTTITPYTITSSTILSTGSTQPSIYSTSPPVPVTRANRDISYGQDRPYVPPVSAPMQNKPKTNMAEHVKDLHKRSRSPRLGRPSSNEMLRARDDGPGSSLQTPDPATVLGTFSKKKASPVGGPRSEEDQEKPWLLTLPDDVRDGDDDDYGIATAMHNVDAEPQRGRPHTTRETPRPLENISHGEDELSRQVTQSPVSEPDHVSDFRQSREARRLLLERAPSPFLTSSHNIEAHSMRPQTVAERFMGIQSQGRSTTPTTTPPTRNPPNMSSIEIPKKTEALKSIINRGETASTTITTSTSTSSDNRSVLISTTVIPTGADNMLLPGNTGPRVNSGVSQLRAPTPSQPVTNDTMVADHPSKTFAYVELPGSKPDGYESDEEPVMSATAYPGQEWMPLYADDGKWDD